MKLKNYLLPAFMLIAATFTSCKDDPQETILPALKLLQKGSIVTALDAPAEGTTHSVDVSANVDWTATSNAEWLTITPNEGKNTTGEEEIIKVTITIAANPDVEQERTAKLTVTAGTLKGEITVTQAGAAKPTSTIAEVKAAAAEGEFTVAGVTVAAITSRSALLTDGTDFILAYVGSAPKYADETAVAALDKVDITGTTSTYGGLRQFGSNITLTKKGTNAEYAHPTAKTMVAADFTAYVAAPAIEYVTYTGTLTIDGNYYNIAIEGLTGTQGSISYPLDGQVAASLNGANVTVKGYAIGASGSSTKYVNIILTDITQNAGADYTETTIPEITAAGNYSIKNVTVVGTHAKGYMVADAAKNAILVYLNAAHEMKIGDVVDLFGVVSERNGNFQFGGGTTASVKSNSPMTIEYAAITGAQISDYEKGYFPGTVEGVLTISNNGNNSYYNVAIEGTTKIGSISYPAADMIPASADGKKVIIKGWSVGQSTSGETTYFNMMANSVEVVKDVPELTSPYSWTMADGDIAGGADNIVEGAVYEAISGKGNLSFDWVITGTPTENGTYPVGGGSANNRFKIGTGSDLVSPYILTTKALAGYKVTKVTVWAGTATEGATTLSVTVGETAYISDLAIAKTTTAVKSTGFEYASEAGTTVAGDIAVRFDTSAPFYLYTITIEFEKAE